MPKRNTKSDAADAADTVDAAAGNLDLPLGEIVANWMPPPRPARRAMAGTYCIVEPLSIEKHSADLFAANRRDRENRIWVYLPYGPFDTLDAYRQWLADSCLSDDPLFFSIIDRRAGRAAGVASYLRIDPAAGAIEVGHINYAPALQRTVAATEAMFLMMENAFALGYRRYEWKCNALNANSRAAAARLGFTFEGVFRQATVSKSRNRDTAWYAVIDKQWPPLRAAFQTWLSSENFTPTGAQKQSLSTLTATALTPPPTRR